MRLCKAGAACFMDCCSVMSKLGFLRGFSLSRYEVAILPMIRAATRLAPLELLASPWSPPPWMKSNRKFNFGGKLLPRYWGFWARHFVRFAQEMATRGVPLWGVSVQNEPEAATPWESCQWTGPEEAAFIRDFLGPAVQQAELDLKIVAWDHNRDGMLQRAEAIYGDPGAEKYVWGIGYHWSGTWKSVSVVTQLEKRTQVLSQLGMSAESASLLHLAVLLPAV